jgi:hypothetical protein
MKADEPDLAALGEYCRRVEEHLARANHGHLVRIAGMGFEMVRQWALEGIPLSVACRGIDQKAARHGAGRSTRPLRIEFCEGDVRSVYADWHRAVGIAGAAGAAAVSSAEDADEAKRPSFSRHLDRVIAALTRAGGRLETPDELRDVLTRMLEELAGWRESGRRARGEAREVLAARLLALDRELLDAGRAAAGVDEMARLRAEAADDLAAYRGRLPAEAWQRSVDVNLDRLIRDRFGLPTLEW